MTQQKTTPAVLCALGPRMAIICLFASMLGCATPTGSSRPLPAGSTYLFHLPGVSGETPIDHWWMDALRERKVADRFEEYDWTCGDRGLGSLRAYSRNLGQAQAVADRIAVTHRADPTGKVILTAVSGGTAIAVWTLERLPPGVKVDQVVLIAPALSPTYDLTSALRHVTGKTYAFTSRGDVVMLGIGTRIFGTMDRRNVAAAGLMGFCRPASVARDDYRNLVEIPYDPAWLRWGNFGDHTGPMSVCFAREFLAPLLICEN